MFPIDKWELFHIAIGFGLVLANIGVYRGVKLEEEYDAWTKETGRRLLLASLVWEATLAFLLLGVDSYVSIKQQFQIGAATEELAQLVRPRRLSPAQKDRIAVSIGKFSPITFVTVTVPEAEPWDFVMDIAATLKSDGWIWVPCVDKDGRGLKPLDPDPLPSSCTSILDHLQINAPPSLGVIAKALGDAIKEPGIIGMDDVRVEVTNKVTIMQIMVGTKR